MSLVGEFNVGLEMRDCFTSIITTIFPMKLLVAIRDSLRTSFLISLYVSPLFNVPLDYFYVDIEFASLIFVRHIMKRVLAIEEGI